LKEFNKEFRYILPFSVKKNEISFIIFAIWTKDSKENKNHKTKYIEQIWLAIEYYANLLNKTVVLIGDFNSNKIWDYKHKSRSHTDVVNRLAEKVIYSAYHQYFNCGHGEEQHSTFFRYGDFQKRYHIDYGFVSGDIYKKLKNIKIDEAGEWIKYVDHVPLNVEFDI
jgi:exonuclease III